MALFLPIFCLVFAFAGVHGKHDPEADFRKLPKLFHLDDYEQCLARKDGIYCLGMFDVYSDVQPNPIYDLILEKSQDITLYNRSYLHRGYCLATRCPSREANASARFERCVDAWARGHSLRTRLRTLHYCRAHGQPRPREPDTTDLPHQVFLYFVCFLLFMAVVGTVYDVYFAKKGSKNPLLMSFSIRLNWNHFISKNSDVDPRLKELDIFIIVRILMAIGLTYCHVLILTTATYQHNPRYMEKLLVGSVGSMLGSSMTTTLVAIVLSNFLTAYNLLVMSEKTVIGLKFFPLLVLKRIIRIYPLYILLNGFAATWWRSFGDGPMWPVLLASESEICRKKFWVTAAFLQNFINKRELCLVQTWIIAVDLQLHLFTLFITLVLLKHRQHAVKVISLLLVAAIALLAHQAFEQDLIPNYLYMTPEVYRNMFVGGESFFDLYINPMNGMIAALGGTMLAFIHMDHQKRGVDMNKSKIMVMLHYLLFPAIQIWDYMAHLYFRQFDRSTQHIMVVVERVTNAGLLCLSLYTLIHRKGILYRIASLSVLGPLTKMALSVSMSHWCIKILMLTGRWTLHETTGLRLISDIVLVYVSSHIISVPLTVLVEYPMQKFMDLLLNKSAHRWFSMLKKKTQ